MTIGRPPEDVEALVETEAENWMPVLLQQANGHGARLLSELGFKLGEKRIERQIEVTLGSPRRTAGATLIPIRWRAAASSSLFPVLDGQLEIAGLGAASTQLGLSGSYDPPLGLVGKVADRALLHRVAEVTVKEFLESVGQRIESHP